MIQTPNIKSDRKVYDLDERTFSFARDVAFYVNRLPKTITNIEHGKQLTRSSGSVGANYIEANECLSKKDFVLRIKICRKEAKESRYWLQLIEPALESEAERQALLKEATEIMKILGAIVERSK